MLQFLRRSVGENLPRRGDRCRLNNEGVSFELLNLLLPLLPSQATSTPDESPSRTMSSSCDSSRKRPRHDTSSDSHEEEEERTNGHQIDPQQSNLPPPPPPHRQQQYQQHYPQQQPPSDPDALLMPSFFGIEPYDDFTRRVGDWIWSMSKGRDHVEVSWTSFLPFVDRLDEISDKSYGEKITYTCASGAIHHVGWLEGRRGLEVRRGGKEGRGQLDGPSLELNILSRVHSEPVYLEISPYAREYPLLVAQRDQVSSLDQSALDISLLSFARAQLTAPSFPPPLSRFSDRSQSRYPSRLNNSSTHIPSSPDRVQ